MAQGMEWYGEEVMQELCRRMTQVTVKIGKYIGGQAKRYATRANGTMGKSIKTTVIGFGLNPAVIISVNVPYARFVEGFPQTTRKHFVSFRGKSLFEAWGRRHGFKTTNKSGQITGGLLTWGYSLPFFRPAIEDGIKYARALNMKWKD